jgi:mannose-6-phosphate isomerase-like protein (cupin superfamily)
MGSMVDFASLAYRDAGKGVGRAAISGKDAQRLTAEAIRLAPGAALTEQVRDGSDVYFFALTGAAEIAVKGKIHALAQDSFATLEEGTEFTLANRGSALSTLVCVVAPPQGAGAGGAGFRGGISVIARASAPIADIPDQKKRRLYFVDDAAARSERAHAMIVEYQADTVTVMHHHPNADSMFVPLTGTVRFTFNGKDHIVTRGQATVFPAGDHHGLRVEAGKVSFLEFHIPAKYVTVK